MLITEPQQVLFEKGQFSVSVFKGKDDPMLLEKIGRARAVAFREYLPAGTTLDLDDYDPEYHQLYLMNKENHQVVGAYRLGTGPELIALRGQGAFYLNTLFEFPDTKLLGNSLEMGRSFILPEYQQQHLPLLMLWKGVYGIFTQDPRLRCIIGAVSIPLSFSNSARTMLIDYLATYHAHPSGLLTGRNKVDCRPSTIGPQISAIVETLQGEGAFMPILLKKYLAQNAKVAGFNLDPEFGGSVDVLMVMNKEDVPDSTIGYLSKN